jgi:hypothetical protein
MGIAMSAAFNDNVRFNIPPMPSGNSNTGYGGLTEKELSDMLANENHRQKYGRGGRG